MNVLVVAAHPDDEALGCGGTIAMHVARGDSVRVVLMTGGRDEPKLMQAAHAASSVLGVAKLTMHNLPDNALDTLTVLHVAMFVEQEIREVAPEIVYTHHAGDCNIDHRITHDAVLAACRPQPGTSFKALRCFEVLSSTEWGLKHIPFVPDFYVPMSNDVWQNKKLAALECYSSEMRKDPHPRSYDVAFHLAQLRGSSIGFDMAEAFSTVYSIGL